MTDFDFDKTIKAVKGDFLVIDGNILLQKNNNINPKIIADDLNFNAEISPEGLILNTPIIADQFISLSDKTQKHHINEIKEDILEKIEKLGTYSYFLKNKQTKKIGLISQEVKENFPECIEMRDELLYIDYNSIISLLVKSVKELNKELKDIKDKIKNL